MSNMAGPEFSLLRLDDGSFIARLATPGVSGWVKGRVCPESGPRITGSSVPPDLYPEPLLDQLWRELTA